MGVPVIRLPQHKSTCSLKVFTIFTTAKRATFNHPISTFPEAEIPRKQLFFRYYLTFLFQFSCEFQVWKKTQAACFRLLLLKRSLKQFTCALFVIACFVESYTNRTGHVFKR